MKRLLAVILTLSLLLGVAPALSDVDYASDYETALTMARNDLTSAKGLGTAIDMLQQLGSYQLAKSYLQYLQPILDLTRDDANLESIRILIGLCERNSALVSDLETRGFPPCSEILGYIDTRILEAGGDYSTALERYAGMFILDAPDRMQRIVEILMSRTPAVTVISRTDTGEELSRETTEMKRGSEQVFAAPGFEGYALTADCPDRVTVTVDAMGGMNREEVVFVYRKLPDTVPVTVVYRTDAGRELARETVDVERGGSMTVEAKTFDGFDLASGAAKKVQVFADNMGKLSQAEVVFTYRALPAYAEVTVVCQDEGGNQLRTEIVRIDRGSSKTIRAASLDGYELTGTSSAKVTVDSKGNADKSRVVFKYKKIRPKVAVGDYVTFGHYPQKASGNDNTPIEWLVLDIQDGKALLISRYGLDAKPYHEKRTEITWQTCTLRTWLNETFLNTAFNAQERGTILLTHVDNGVNQGCSEWHTSGGSNTRDMVFLLSYAEASRYFGTKYSINSFSMKSRIAPTAYARLKGAFFATSFDTATGLAAGWWWLRSPGSGKRYAAYVSIDGSIKPNFVDFPTGCVRPALWVDLNANIF